AARAQRTDATEYALRLGAEVVEVRPAYLSVVQSRARDRAAQLGEHVRWDVMGAVRDATEQVAIADVPAKRIVVPTGSGLTAAGVLAGLHMQGYAIPVLCVAVSPMAEAEDIRTNAKATVAAMVGTVNRIKLPPLRIVRAKQKYEQWTAGILPDGSPLD